MQLVDCFTFFNELDMLDLRLHEMAGVVDRFVLVEATRTFSGKPKPLWFAENRDRFAGFPIEHVVVDDMPTGRDAWAREAHQRDAIVRGLGGLAPDDVVILSDVDEITRGAVLPWLKDECPAVCGLEMDFCYYRVNWLVGKWDQAKAMRRSYLHGRLPDGIRKGRYADGATAVPAVADAGWHYSYMGGTDAIRQKIDAYSHQEFNLPAYTDPAHVEECIRSGRDLFGRFPLTPVADPDVPAYLAANRERYAAWFAG